MCHYAYMDNITMCHYAYMDVEGREIVSFMTLIPVNEALFLYVR